MTWRRNSWVGALKASDLTTIEKAVARVYADYSTGTGQSWVVRTVLCTETSLSEKSVKRAVHTLTQTGWLQVLRRAQQHQSPVYQLRTPRGALSDPPGTPLA